MTDADIIQAAKRERDAFGRLKVEQARNEITFPSHFNFDPERLRLHRNGGRVFLMYGDIPQFTDEPDIYRLQPDAGDTMHVESAESGTYTVNFFMEYTWAFQLNRELNDGDVLKFGPYNGSDGWYAEQRGESHSANEVDIFEEAAGDRTKLASNVKLPQETTKWWRYVSEWGWYAVLNQAWEQTHTDDGDVYTDQFAKTSRDGERGPETGNLNIWIEIEAADDSDDLELHLGSMSMMNLGFTTSIQRDKPQVVQIETPSTNDTWLPIYATRISPDNSNVNANVAEVDILSYGNNALAELVIASFHSSKTNIAEGDWGEPGYHHDYGSIMQDQFAPDTPGVFEVADDTGTVQQLGSDDKFGGFTIASAAIAAGGNTVTSTGSQTSGRIEKKPVLASDRQVYLFRSSNAGGTITFVWDYDQEW